jgi:hypothetical protein
LNVENCDCKQQTIGEHTMTDLYARHTAAFKSVAAFVIIGTDDCGAPVRRATVAFKYGAGGMVHCYLHIFGGQMTYGRAGGGGYDKASSAIASAAAKTCPALHDEYSRADGEKIRAALLLDEGAHWDNQVHKAGFLVFQAV